MADKSSLLVSAAWKRLDLEGKDTAALFHTASGYRLEGTAQWKDDSSMHVEYVIETDPMWQAVSGSVTAKVGRKKLQYRIERTDTMWLLNGTQIEGLEELVDLDFDFTPATNYLQLRRIQLFPGDAKQLPVAWFELGSGELRRLDQSYARIGPRTYAYEAPACEYKDHLQLSESGFIRVYPGLWQAVESSDVDARV